MASGNFKGQLNELAMKSRWRVSYDHSVSGPPHMPDWRTTVKVDTGHGMTYNANGSGKSKLDSQHNACKKVLEDIARRAEETLRQPVAYVQTQPQGGYPSQSPYPPTIATPASSDYTSSSVGAPPGYHQTAPYAGYTPQHVNPLMAAAPRFDQAPLGNPKGQLLEYCAKHRLLTDFRHECVGEAHSSEWTATVTVRAGDKLITTQSAVGKTKKIAEHNVALVVLPLLKQGAQAPPGTVSTSALPPASLTENYKGKLNEICQHLSTTPEYIAESVGVDHAKTWTAVVKIHTPRGLMEGKGTGQAKKMAEQLAARDLLLRIQNL
eukprot:TRINITY_DN7863_c0_g1_i1.p1 TRINITY_DN7863_c0_g1~~TRINITY_DN7863_c0_g1_i1.p1  ORF type:complete len:322 (+),score=68.30 TRINITY_DN7863_c0_g1_i1:89-1054(+)